MKSTWTKGPISSISVLGSTVWKRRHSPMWKGRFQQETAPAVQRFTESISFDWRLYKFDIQGSIAHASALAKAGLLTPEERQQIESGLKDIEQEIDADRFPFRMELEDVHMNIESAL